MTRPVRLTSDPNDRPAEGEALARLVRPRRTRETYPGAGRNGTDLTVTRTHTLLSVEMADGRRLVTGWRDGTGAPEIEDLLQAWRDAWQEIPIGRPRKDAPPEVRLYEQEVDRRIKEREPTEIEVVAGLRQWAPRTMRRHIQRAGFRRWPDFVTSRREAVARERSTDST